MLNKQNLLVCGMFVLCSFLPANLPAHYMPEESYLRWVCDPPGPVVTKAIEHFQRHFPKIKQHRAGPVELPPGISRMVLTHESGEEEVVYERGE